MCDDGDEDLGYWVRERSTEGGEKSQCGMLECLYVLTLNLNLGVRRLRFVRAY